MIWATLFFWIFFQQAEGAILPPVIHNIYFHCMRVLKNLYYGEISLTAGKRGCGGAEINALVNVQIFGGIDIVFL